MCFFIFWERMKSNFWIVLFPLGLYIAFKGDTVRYFCCLTNTRGAKQPSYVTRPDCSARLVKMADSGDLNLLRRPSLDSEKNLFGSMEYFLKRNISFLAYFEHFKQYLL